MFDLAKFACGAFADNASVPGGKRRDFCRLHSASFFHH
jgi:hypothetical protein